MIIRQITAVYFFAIIQKFLDRRFRGRNIECNYYLVKGRREDALRRDLGGVRRCAKAHDAI
jgi:hypothetical protein